MSHLAAWIQTPFAQALGWTLVHFVWEGAVMAAVLMALLSIFRHSPAHRRYALACAILAAMPLVFSATLAVMWARQPGPIAWVPLRDDALALITAPPSAGLPAPAPRSALAALLDRLSWLVPFWIAGVLFFYLRGAAAWVAVQRLRRRGVCAPSAEWQARLNELAARLRLARPVMLLESCFADTPVLIGYLRPMILLPLGCLTGLSAGQVECILLHELAHVERHDYLVNLLQSVVEGLLFYHPAVWWASRMVRAERENCCDDQVVEIMGDARSYAAALAVLEERRATAPQAALAATGGNLMKRIRRLTMEPRRPQTSIAPAVSAALLVIFAAGLTALPAKLPAVRRPRTVLLVPPVALYAAPAQVAAAAAQDTASASPYGRWVKEDVAYIITNSERAAFRKLQTDTEREAFIEQFWKLRDPTPDTPENEFKDEHYRRIAYTNEHFGDAAGVPGWKTDRGRIYITYGPPDEIDDHSAGGNYQRPPAEGGGVVVTHPFQQWRYRYIEGVGENVIIEFVDDTGSGAFHMTSDPAEKEKLLAFQVGGPNLGPNPRIFESHLDRTVSVIVPGRTPPGVIGVGDVLDVANTSRSASSALRSQTVINLDAVIAARRGELANLLGKYSPQYPVVVAVQKQLDGLEAQRESIETSQGGPQSEQLRNLKREENDLATQFEVSSVQLVNLQKRASDLSNQLNVLESRVVASRATIGNDNASPQEDMQMLGSEVEVKLQLPATQSEIAKVNQQIAEERRKQRLLASTLSNNRNMQSQFESSLYDRPLQSTSRITVRSDGGISIGRAQDIQAAGLTPAQLESALGPGVTVRIEQASAQQPQLVRVLVSLSPGANHFHVFGEVRNQVQKVVQSFEEDLSGQPALSKDLPLRAGSYHLVIVVKNMETGVARNSSLDFTIN